MDSNLTIQFTGTKQVAGRGSTWLNLEQDAIQDVTQAANLYDLNQMIARAQSGLSARTYRPADCPTEITGSTVKIMLDFFVFPASMAMPYSVTASLGTIDDQELVSLQREFDVVLPLAESVELPFLIDGVADWQTQAFDRYGGTIPRPEAIIDDGRLDVGTEVFGVLRVAGIAHGYRHTLTIELPFSSGAKITDLRPSVTASWLGGDGKLQTTILSMEIPDCVKDIIEDCPGTGATIVGGSVTESDDSPLIPMVYYSTCTGKVLGLRYE